ncbi:MAG: TonB-dependent receptor [Gammaproteobacteria bacterium]|nr:TonB-dependent receptor [Gammaproteobacteria bacterium]
MSSHHLAASRRVPSFCFHTLYSGWLTATVIGCQLLGAAAMAQSGSGSDALDPLVVTATRSEQTLTDTLTSMAVIDRELIERSQAQSLLELLRLQAGVDIVRSGGPGGQTSVFLRGANSNQVLVLIDGVRVASATSGLFQFENLPLEQIERIEIVRGPRASVYGSDAIGGVIQIFTRREITPTLRLGYGSDDQYQASAAAGWSGEQARVSGSLSWRDSNGFSAQNADGFSFDPDDDGFENFGASINGDVQLGDGQLQWLALLTDAEVEFDQGLSDGTQQTYALGYRFDQGRWQHQTRISYNIDDLDSDFGFFSTAFDSERLQLSWLTTVRLDARLRLSAGIDAYQEWGEDEGNFDDNRHNIGAFALADWRHAGHAVDASVRVDEDERFGSELTGSVAYGYRFGKRLQLHASYGRGFRAPTFNQLFSPGFAGQFAGNPALEAETSDAFELGLRFSYQQHRLNLTGFHQQIDDLIDFSGPEFQAVNIAQAEVTGVELEYQFVHRHWLASATATLQDPKDKTSDSKLLRRPDEKLSLSVDRLFGNGSWLGLELFYSGKAQDFATTLDDYVLLNLRAGWQLAEQWRLEARVDNLLDANYTQAVGFNTRDLAAFLGLRWQP